MTKEERKELKKKVAETRRQTAAAEKAAAIATDTVGTRRLPARTYDSPVENSSSEVAEKGGRETHYSRGWK